MSQSTAGVMATRASRQILSASTLGLALSFAAAPAAAQTAAQTSGQGATQLPSISVEGQGTGDGYKVDQLQSPKYTAPLLDTPRSVTVIPQ